VKRAGGNRNSNSTVNSAPMAAAGGAPGEQARKDVVVDSSEVQSLKKRIEEMTKNIDHLSAMVEKVSIKQEETDKKVEQDREQLVGNNKRKKVAAPYDAYGDYADQPARVLSNMELEDIALPVLPSTVVSMPEPVSVLRETSASSMQSMTLSDGEFAEELFSAFAEEEGLALDDPSAASSDPSALAAIQPLDEVAVAAADTRGSIDDDSSNRPDPELMRKLSDALMLLPKEIQEMIVDRLVAAITSSNFVDAMDSKPAAVEELPAEVPQSPRNDKPKTTMPLAAATLAALLQQYTHLVEQQGASKSPKNLQKTIPVIPVHA